MLFDILSAVRLPGFLILGGFIISSCNSSLHNKAGVLLAMKKYDHLILKLDADSISELYTADGNMGNLAIGRDSIKKFLLSFKNIRVLSQSSVPDSTNIVDDTAIQKGRYYQSDIIAEKDTIKVKGEYTARWEWVTNEGWRIKKMETKPAK